VTSLCLWAAKCAVMVLSRCYKYGGSSTLCSPLDFKLVSSFSFLSVAETAVIYHLDLKTFFFLVGLVISMV